MALLTNQQVNINGIVANHIAAANPHTVDVTSRRTTLSVINTSGASITVTITTNRTDTDGNAIAAKVVTVPNGTTPTLIGPLNPDNYGLSGVATLTFSATANVSIAAIQL